MHRSLALALAALLVGCGTPLVALEPAVAFPTGPAAERPPRGPAEGPAEEPFVFRVEPPPVFRTDGFRIATFNAEFLFDGEGNEGAADFPWKGDPVAARAHRDAVAAVVRTLDADLVVLTETEHVGVLRAMLAESLPDLGYTAHLVPGHDTFTGQNVGLLARVPLDSLWRTDERVAVGLTERTYGVSKNLAARFSLDGQPVTLVGVHFLAYPDNVERRPQREAQAEVIRRLVEREKAAGRAVVVLGDLNDFDPDVPDANGSRPITNVLATVRRAGPSPDDDLVSVLAELPQRRRFTAHWDRNRNGVVDQGELSAIDHVLLSPVLAERVLEVHAVHAHDPAAVSDHWPVVVTIGAE